MMTPEKTRAFRRTRLPRVRRGRLALCSACLLSLSGMVSPAFAADTATVGVGATVLSKNICKFDTNNVTLAFGTINAATGGNATASASLQLVCHGASPSAWFAIEQDGSLYRTGPTGNRMKHVSLGEYLPYSLTITPGSGNVAKNAKLTVSLQGTVSPEAFQNVSAGAYADTVVLTIVP